MTFYYSIYIYRLFICKHAGSQCTFSVCTGSNKFVIVGTDGGGMEGLNIFQVVNKTTTSSIKQSFFHVDQLTRTKDISLRAQSLLQLRMFRSRKVCSSSI